ncbi:hypothetical protein ZWY2020_012350 [Hordeum vulgare]|nr:hypothetical protein ZWY2020_012350 [Hordeum vulgare]
MSGSSRRQRGAFELTAPAAPGKLAAWRERSQPRLAPGNRRRRRGTVGANGGGARTPDSPSVRVSGAAAARGHQAAAVGGRGGAISGGVRICSSPSARVSTGAGR